MVFYNCEKCGKEFNRKSNYLYHINNVSNCVKIKENQIFKCSFCNVPFTLKNNLKRHEKCCKNKEKYMENINNEYIKNKISNNIDFNNLDFNNLDFNCLKNKVVKDLTDKVINDIKINTNEKDILSLLSDKIYNELKNENNIDENNNIDKNNNIDENNNINENNSNSIKKNSNNLTESIIKKKLNGFIYILREREFIKTNENIYKIGKTSRENIQERFKEYPNNSKLYSYWDVDNIDEFEKILKSIFNLKFKNMNEIGTEYYEGDIEEMILTIECMISFLNNIRKPLKN
jgi:hypothetical protein